MKKQINQTAVAAEGAAKPSVWQRVFVENVFKKFDYWKA